MPSFPSLRIGTAQVNGDPTGCTVFLMPEPVNGYQQSLLTVDIRGGAVGQSMGQDGLVDAVCFSGGSLHGLQAATGVMAGIAAQRGNATEVGRVPVVAGACIYDFLAPGRLGGYPNRKHGRRAYWAALRSSGECPEGNFGAGTSARVGKMGFELGFEDILSEPGGQGAASGSIRLSNGNEYHVFVCSVVNAMGAVLDVQGQVARGHLDSSGRRLTGMEILERSASLPCTPPATNPTPQAPGRNTTLTFVAINFPCSDYYARQIARQIHTSMARVIDPFHTLSDGDVLYLVRMNLDWLSAPEELWHEGATKIGLLGSALAQEAVRRACK